MPHDSDEILYQQARRTMRFLLLGTDPETRLSLSEECVVRTPEVRRSLSLALDAMEDGNRIRAYLRKSPDRWLSRALHKASERQPAPVLKRARPARAGEAWDEIEKQKLLEGFLAGMKVGVLAKLHQRTAGAITAQLVHQGICLCRDDARAGRASALKKPMMRVVVPDSPQAVAFGAE